MFVFSGYGHNWELVIYIEILIFGCFAFLFLFFRETYVFLKRRFLHDLERILKLSPHGNLAKAHVVWGASGCDDILYVLSPFLWSQEEGSVLD